MGVTRREKPVRRPGRFSCSFSDDKVFRLVREVISDPV